MRKCKKKEAKEGFNESVGNEKKGKKTNFFRLGKKNNYKDTLDLNIRKENRSKFSERDERVGIFVDFRE